MLQRCWIEKNRHKKGLIARLEANEFHSVNNTANMELLRKVRELENTVASLQARAESGDELVNEFHLPIRSSPQLSVQETPSPRVVSTSATRTNTPSVCTTSTVFVSTATPTTTQGVYPQAVQYGVRFANPPTANVYVRNTVPPVTSYYQQRAMPQCTTTHVSGLQPVAPVYMAPVYGQVAAPNIGMRRHGGRCFRNLTQWMRRHYPLSNSCNVLKHLRTRMAGSMIS